jgi:predicted NAD-dependent protein-ADP-ribosyltransferase YbiA (DUF1768 family)
MYDNRIQHANPQQLEEASLPGENKIKIGNYFYTVVKIHSQAKWGDALYLSNSTPLITPLCIDGKMYVTVEHYYQSMKYTPSKREMFEIKGSVKTAMEAKNLGCIASMKRMTGHTINFDEWHGPAKDNSEDYFCIRTMKKALCARFHQDERFRNILLTPFLYFEHYEKSKGKFDPDRIPFWGCYTQKGKLSLDIVGNLFNELAMFSGIHNYLQYTVDGKQYLNWTGFTVPPIKVLKLKYPRCNEQNGDWKCEFKCKQRSNCIYSKT